MYRGYPEKLLPLIKCPDDGQDLVLLSDAIKDESGSCVLRGTLQCAHCAGKYSIEEGIVLLLDRQSLNGESAREEICRDGEADTWKQIAQWDAENFMEMHPTIHALDPKPGQLLLELGCGPGRYTLAVADAYAGIVAVDLSLGALKSLARVLHEFSPVGLIQANIVRFSVSRGSFDTVLSTLVSNLPDREHRNKMYRLAGQALHEQGTFVFSTHHYSIRDLILRVPKSGYYKAGGIYRYYLTRGELLREVRPFFKRARIHPIRIRVPFAMRLRLPFEGLSFISERVPLLRLLGELLLAKVSRAARVILLLVNGAAGLALDPGIAGFVDLLP